jgi:hypothetical protein
MDNVRIGGGSKRRRLREAKRYEKCGCYDKTVHDILDPSTD